MRLLLALIALVMLTGAREPILVPEVSQHEIQLRQGFTGTELLLFGAILSRDGTRAARDYDIVVILKGPTQSIVVREKAKVETFGMEGRPAKAAPAKSEKGDSKAKSK